MVDRFRSSIVRAAARRRLGCVPAYGHVAGSRPGGPCCARITCVDPKQLAPPFAGREFDTALLDELPPSVDRCGERGEFHTFAYGGPMFGRPIGVRQGEVVVRDGFVFADLIPEMNAHNTGQSGEDDR